MSIKNAEEMRDFLIKQMEGVAAGVTTPAAANANANVAGKILKSLEIELDYNKMAGATPNIKFLSKGLNDKIKKLESQE